MKMKIRANLKLSIKSRLILSYVTISIFIVLSLLITSNVMIEKQFQKYVIENQENLNQGIVSQLLNQYLLKGSWSEEFLMSIGENALDRGVVLMVHDSSGKEIFCMSCVNKMECDNMIDAMEQTMRERYPNWQGEYTEKAYEIKTENEFYGTAVLGYYGPFYYNAQDVEFINMINKRFLTLSALFLFIAVCAGYIISNRISRPIKDVIRKTSEIECGKYSDRIETISDIKELDKLVSSVNNLANTLELQQRIQKRMAGDFAHEFRTPLTSLQVNIEGIMDGILEPRPDRLKSCLEEIMRLTRMIDDIDKIVEIENENLILSKQKIEINSLIENILLTFEAEAKKKNIKLEFDEEKTYIIADRDKLSQVFINLISNAVKYTDFGSISIRFEHDDEHLKIKISDTGIGIPSEDIPNIFDYLYRSDQSRSRESGGSGIGLSIVKSIVLAHGGQISAKSQLGSGTEITITLNKGF